MMESFSWLYVNRKSGKKRSLKGTFFYGLLYTWVFGVVAVIFYLLAQELCEPLTAMGVGWLYFAVMGMLSIVLGVFGSVFNTAGVLYQAKDNDLLLSMPITTGKILIMRLSGVCALGMLYELLVMIPTLIVWFRYETLTPAAVLFSLCLPFVLSLLILTLSCMVGWVVTKVGIITRNKTIVPVILTLGFIFVYYYVCYKAYNYLLYFLGHAKAIAQKTGTIWNPLYHMGRAAQGSLVSMCFTILWIAVCFGILYWILWRSFLHMAISNSGSAKIRYKEKKIKASGADAALLRKEWKRFSGCYIYLMNCGLGTLLLTAAGAALIWKRDVIRQTLYAIFAPNDPLLPILAAAAICSIASMNDITAPSISLEGKNLWLVQVLPVSKWQILRAKLCLHLLLTEVPGLLLTVCVLYIFSFDAGYAVWMLVSVALFALVMAEIGLAVNLKIPMLDWTSEVAPVKQGMSVMIALFGGWIIILVFAGAYYLISNFVSTTLYMGMIAAVLLLMALLLRWWLKYRGTKILEML